MCEGDNDVQVSENASELLYDGTVRGSDADDLVDQARLCPVVVHGELVELAAHGTHLRVGEEDAVFHSGTLLIAFPTQSTGLGTSDTETPAVDFVVLQEQLLLGVEPEIV